MMKGLLVDLKLYPSPTNCYASCPSVFAIDSKGDLYKCHRVLGKGQKYSSGNVKTGIEKMKFISSFVIQIWYMKNVRIVNYYRCAKEDVK